MRIALACPYAWDAPGGVQMHVRQLSRHLRARGHHTLVLAPAWTRPPEPEVVVVGRPIRVPFNGSVAAIAPDPRGLQAVRAELDRFAPDVIHVHEPFSPSTAMFAALAARGPVVATFHAYGERSAAVAVASPALRWLWRRATVRIAVSEAAASYAHRHFRGEMRVVPNGVDIEPFRAAVPASLPPGRPLLFVNRLEPRKGFPVAVAAFALVARERPDVLLVVAGDGPERRAADDLPEPVRHRVLLLGMVPHVELAGYHAAAEAFLAPAVGGESFGIVLVEAMAAGLPVAGSDIPGYREVVRDGREGLLVPRSDPPALAGAIRRLLDDPALAARLGAAGRARAERYRWEIVVEEVERAYLDAVSAPLPPAGLGPRAAR